MPNPYSPIDESSFSDTASFDPEEMLNPRRYDDTTDQRSDISSSEAPSHDTYRTPSAPVDNTAARAAGVNGTVATASAQAEAETPANARPKRFTALNAILDGIRSMRTF